MQASLRKSGSLFHVASKAPPSTTSNKWNDTSDSKEITLSPPKKRKKKKMENIHNA